LPAPPFVAHWLEGVGVLSRREIALNASGKIKTSSLVPVSDLLACGGAPRPRRLADGRAAPDDPPHGRLGAGAGAPAWEVASSTRSCPELGEHVLYWN